MSLQEGAYYEVPTESASLPFDLGALLLAGRVTEVAQRQWVNPGWHMDRIGFTAVNGSQRAAERRQNLAPGERAKRA